MPETAAGRALLNREAQVGTGPVRVVTSGAVDAIEAEARALGRAEALAAAPGGTRLVLMSEELALQLGASRVDWGEPDEHGWYTPTLYKETR